MMIRVLLTAIPILALAEATAATFTITTLGDSGPGSQRQAILDANSANGEDTITFTVNGTITLAAPLPPITDSTTISGPGTNLLTVSGANAVTIFSVASGCSNAVIQDLTIANGRATGNANGAGVANAGTLTLFNCVLVNNQTLGGWGGGIFNSGALRVLNSSFARNQVTGDPGQGGGWNTHFSCGGQMRGGGGGGGGMGGALFNSTGAAYVNGCSFVSNSATGGRGGDYNADGCGRGGGVNGGAGNPSSFFPGQPGGFGSGGGGSDTASGGNGGFGGGGGGGAYAGGAGGFGGGTGGGFGSGGVVGGGGGGAGIGGAIFADAGTVVILNSISAGNQAVGGLGGHGDNSFDGGPGSGIGPDFYIRTATVLPRLTAVTPGGGKRNG